MSGGVGRAFIKKEVLEDYFMTGRHTVVLIAKNGIQK